MSNSTICRTLKYMGCTRQAMHHVALQQSEIDRAEFMAQISYMTLQCWCGWMRVDVIAATQSGNMAIACEACLRQITVFLLGVLGTL